MIIDVMSDEKGGRRGGRPRKDQIDSMEQALLRAARSVFLAKGYANATMTEIAALAQASKRTIYDRHPNKAVLFEAAISAFIAEKFSQIGTWPLREGSLRDQLLCLAEGLCLLTAEEEIISVHRIVAAEQTQFPDLVKRLHRYGFERAINLLLSIFEENGVGEALIAAEFFYATFVLAPLQNLIIVQGSLEKRIDFFMRGLGLPDQA